MWCERDLELGCEFRLFQQTWKAGRRMRQSSNIYLSGTFACNMRLTLGATHMHCDVQM